MVICKFNQALGKPLGRRKGKEWLEWSDEQNKTKSVVIWQPSVCQLLARRPAEGLGFIKLIPRNMKHSVQWALINSFDLEKYCSFKIKVVVVSCRFSLSSKYVPIFSTCSLHWYYEVWYISNIVDLADMLVKLSCILPLGRIKEIGIWLSNLFSKSIHVWAHLILPIESLAHPQLVFSMKRLTEFQLFPDGMWNNTGLKCISKTNSELTLCFTCSILLEEWRLSPNYQIQEIRLFMSVTRRKNLPSPFFNKLQIYHLS